MRRRPWEVRLVLALGLLALIPAAARSESTSGVAEHNDRFSSALATGDFNGDGKDDLAVGVDGEDIGGAVHGGAVNVIYGSTSGLTPTDDEVWYQGTVGVLGGPEDDDRFGSDLASGDFNGDDFDDLAVGVPAEDVSAENAGAVNLIYGSAEGLTEVGDQLLTQGNPEEFDHFGRSLAAGDFDGDGIDDLAVGAPNEDLEGFGDESAGLVTRFLGSEAGLAETGFELNQNNVDHDQTETGDEFGASLAAGNLGLGIADDLVIGVPHEDFDEAHQGAVHVLFGGDGFSTQQFWHQDAAGIKNAGENSDEFGRSLAIANFGNGQPADLAIGVPREDVEIEAGQVDNAGVVHVLYGTPELGLTAANDQLWHQTVPGIAGRIEADDEFGYALTAGQLGNGLRADLAVSIIREDAGSGEGKGSVGAAQILFGTQNGLSSAGNELWHQDVEGIKDNAESNDRFGGTLASGNFGAGPIGDLAIGVTEEEFGDIRAGAANVIYGTENGLTADGDQFWHQVVP